MHGRITWGTVEGALFKMKFFNFINAKVLLNSDAITILGVRHPSYSLANEHQIVNILTPDFPTGRGAISPEQRVALFLSHCAGRDTQV